MGQHGKAVVIKAGADWEVLADNDLDNEAVATPAIFDTKLFIRTQ